MPAGDRGDTARHRAEGGFDVAGKNRRIRVNPDWKSALPPGAQYARVTAVAGCQASSPAYCWARKRSAGCQPRCARSPGGCVAVRAASSSLAKRRSSTSYASSSQRTDCARQSPSRRPSGASICSRPSLIRASPAHRNRNPVCSRQAKPKAASGSATAATTTIKPAAARQERFRCGLLVHASRLRTGPRARSAKRSSLRVVPRQGRWLKGRPDSSSGRQYRNRCQFEDIAIVARLACVGEDGDTPCRIEPMRVFGAQRKKIAPAQRRRTFLHAEALVGASRAPSCCRRRGTGSPAGYLRETAPP